MSDREEGAMPRLDDAPTFEAVFVTEYPKMVALAAAVSGRRDQAEDIAQDPYVTVSTRRPSDDR